MPPPSYKQLSRSVQITTPLDDCVLLCGKLTGTEALGRPFQYTLELSSEDHEINHEDLIGQNITVAFEQSGAIPRYFNGFVSRFSQTRYEGDLAQYKATLVPWLWFLTRSSDCRIFQNMKVPDILKQVFKDFGYSDVIDRLHGSYRTWNYCVQYRETAFNFVSRLMEEEGIYYFFKHETDKHSIVLCDSPASHKQYQGYEEFLYRPTSEGTQEVIKSWVLQHEVQADGFAVTNFDFTAPTASPLATSFNANSDSQSKLEHFEYLGEQSPFDEYTTGAPNENERYSKMRLEEVRARYQTYSGDGDVRGISTGACFTLTGHPRADYAQEYLTTGAEYVIAANPFETSDEYGKEFQFEVKFTAISLNTQFRTPRTTPKPVVHGPQTATVVGESGQKITTDPTGYGMVKVQFHWDRVGTNDQNSSCFIRVSQSWASKNWGDMAIPHVGDEVIVECLEGDPDRPIVTGRVYNQSLMPPRTLPTNQDKRIWMDEFGNRMIFDATAGDEHIRLYSPHHSSGITLGRSTATWTESNAIAGSLGMNISSYFGSNVSTTVGLAVSAVAGMNVSSVLGANCTLNWASQLTVNLGPQVTFTKGQAMAYGGGDDNKVANGSVLISAAKSINIVGGGAHSLTSTATNSTMLFANNTEIELTAGDKAPVAAAGPTGLGIALITASFALPVAAAALMAGTGGFVDKYNNNTNDDAESTKALAAQTALEVTAGVLEGLALLVTLGVSLNFKSLMTETPSSVRHGPATARLRLFSKAQGSGDSAFSADISTMAAGGTALAHGTTGAGFLVNDGSVNLTHPTKVVIQFGTTSAVIVDTNGVTINGTAVKVTGQCDLVSGAVTITGAGTPVPPSPLIAVQAAITAANTAHTATTVANNATTAAANAAATSPP